MLRPRPLVAILALSALWATPAFVRARGCLAAGTLVSTPSGPVAVEKLAPGDTVWSIGSAGLHRATVAGTFQVTAPVMLRIRADGRELRVTPEHPLQTRTGTFTEAGRLHPGDRLWLWKEDALHAVTIESIDRERDPQPAYNLLVFPGGTYLADGFAVHNKGCFLPDTPIRRADGTDVPIRTIRIGDRLEAFDPDDEPGRIVTTTVLSIVTLPVDGYCRVTTDQLTLDVTEEHPFYVGNGTFRTLSSLHVGDSVFALVGDRLTPQHIVSIERIDRAVTVYNLQTDSPHTFFANGIAVHNKGGGGGHGGFGGGGFHGGYRHYGYGYHSHSGSGQLTQSETWFVLGLVIFVMIAIVGFSAWQSAHSLNSADNLDFVHSRSQIVPVSEHTDRILEHLARSDPSVDPRKLKEIVGSTFTRLQECWQARHYEPMEPLLMADLYHSHLTQLAAMVRQHEIDHIDDLKILHVDLVNIRYMRKPERREFTALITASARDYYTDDRTGDFLRGDRHPAPFQEFWIFHFSGGRWLLREIEQSRESDVLRENSVVESMDPSQIEQVAGARPATVHAPWADPASSARAPRLETQLDELAKSDPAWERSLLQSRARDLFLAVLMVEETGDISQIAAGDLSSSALAHLQTTVAARKNAGETVEFRNLCVRKTEIVLAEPNPALEGSHCTVRVHAHAQTIVTRNRVVIQSDPYERPFVQYITLELSNNRWQLRSIDRAPAS